MSQKLSMFLLVFGIIWGLMLLRYTFQYPRRQSSAELRGQILDLSRRYVKALAEENKNLMNGGGGTSMAGYGKRKKPYGLRFSGKKDILIKLPFFFKVTYTAL